MCILALILGLSFPFIKASIRNYDFRSFVNKTYLFLDYAKTQAVLNSKEVKVRIDQDEKTILIFKDDKADKINIPESIALKTENDTITFYPDGTSNEFELTITSAGSDVVFSGKGFNGKIEIE